MIKERHGLVFWSLLAWAIVATVVLVYHLVTEEYQKTRYWKAVNERPVLGRIIAGVNERTYKYIRQELMRIESRVERSPVKCTYVRDGMETTTVVDMVGGTHLFKIVKATSGKLITSDLQDQIDEYFRAAEHCSDKRITGKGIGMILLGDLDNEMPSYDWFRDRGILLLRFDGRRLLAVTEEDFEASSSNP